MENHKPLTKSSYRSIWKLSERELPDTHVNAHILRHTYITRLFEAGLDIKEIQYLAGHSTIDMTPRVCTHYDRLSRNAQTAGKVREALQAVQSSQMAEISHEKEKNRCSQSRNG